MVEKCFSLAWVRDLGQRARPVIVEARVDSREYDDVVLRKDKP
jgi:hypothetical protein